MLNTSKWAGLMHSPSAPEQMTWDAWPQAAHRSIMVTFSTREVCGGVHNYPPARKTQTLLPFENCTQHQSTLQLPCMDIVKRPCLLFRWVKPDQCDYHCDLRGFKSPPFKTDRMADWQAKALMPCMLSARSSGKSFSSQPASWPTVSYQRQPGC